MSTFNDSDLFMGESPFDVQIGESDGFPGEDGDVLNDETFGAAEIVDWETEHARLSGLDLNGFEEFGAEFPVLESSHRNGALKGQSEAIGIRNQTADDSDFWEMSSGLGVDVEKDLQRLVLEVDRDDRIETAWLSADPAIKMLSKKIPGSQDKETVDVLDASPKVLPSLDDAIWAPSPPKPGFSNAIPPHALSGAKTVAELEGELVEDVHRQHQQQMNQPPQYLSPQTMPHPGVADGSLSPTPPQQLLLQQQQQLAAAALFQQQQQRQSPHPQPTRPMLPPFHPYLNRSAGVISPVAPAVSQMLMHPNASSPIGLAPQQMELFHLHLLMQQRQQQQEQQQQAALLRSHLEAVNEQIQTQQRLQQQQYQARHQQNDRRWQDNDQYPRQRRFSDHIGPDRPNSDDPYSGLMTRSEKEWLISIHHRQLEVENPFVQDYYYTQFVLKKDLAARRAAMVAGQLPLPPDPLVLLRAPVEIPDQFDDSLTTPHASTYTPSQFANTLGKLTTASVHNPRKVIDARVHRDSADYDDVTISGQEPVRKLSTGSAAIRNQERYRRILLTIENCYTLLLKIQEYDISIAKILVPNAPSRHVLILDHQRLKQQLIDTALASETSFVDLFRVRKGALLFARMLNKLEMKYVDLCIRSFFKCFPTIRHSTQSAEVLDDVAPEFMKLVIGSLNILDGSLTLRNLLFYIWMNTNHAEILSHSMGLSLVLAILNEYASSINDQDEVKHLQRHLEQMAMNLLMLPMNRLVRPYSSYLQLLNYMKSNLPEVMRENFNDTLVLCMTTGKEDPVTAPREIPQNEGQTNEQPVLREINPQGNLNPLVASASSA